jgi:hypothetical protein
VVALPRAERAERAPRVTPVACWAILALKW